MVVVSSITSSASVRFELFEIRPRGPDFLFVVTRKHHFLFRLIDPFKCAAQGARLIVGRTIEMIQHLIYPQLKITCDLWAFAARHPTADRCECGNHHQWVLFSYAFECDFAQ